MTHCFKLTGVRLWPLALALGAGGATAATPYNYTAITANNAHTVTVIGLNNLGQVAGTSSDATGLLSQGFVYNSASASYTWLSGPAGALATQATGISDTGLVVGTAFGDLVTDPNSGDQYYGSQSVFVFDGTSYTTLNVAGLDSVTARSISQSGRYVTGWGVDTATNTLRSFVLDRQNDNQVTIVAGNTGSLQLVFAGVDDNGTVVGSETWRPNNTGPLGKSAVSYDIASGALTYHTFDSVLRAAYRDINARGEVVGYVLDTSALDTNASGPLSFYGLVGTLGDTEVFLGPDVPGSTGVVLQANNDAGWITGNYTVGDRGYAFLATPVPEPAPALLLTLGLAALAWRRRQTA